MQKRKIPKDANQLAAQIVALSTGQPIPSDKNPAAVANHQSNSSSKQLIMNRFNSVAEAAAALAEDPKIKQRVENEIMRNSLVVI